MLSVTAGRYRASGCSTAKALGCLGTDADDGDRAARIIIAALGIETDAVANYCLPQYWPTAREQRASIIGNWLQAEAAIPGLMQLEQVRCLAKATAHKKDDGPNRAAGWGHAGVTDA